MYPPPHPSVGSQATPCVLALRHPSLVGACPLSCDPCPHSIQSTQDGSGSHGGTLPPRAQLAEGVPWPADTTETLRRRARQGESFIVALVLIISIISFVIVVDCIKDEFCISKNERRPSSAVPLLSNEDIRNDSLEQTNKIASCRIDINARTDSAPHGLLALTIIDILKLYRCYLM